MSALLLCAAGFCFRQIYDIMAIKKPRAAPMLPLYPFVSIFQENTTMKRFLLKAATAIAIAACIIFAAACDSKPNQESKAESQASTESSAESSAESKAESVAESSADPADLSYIKITGASDKAGIYAITIKLKNGAPDKGSFDMTFYGEKGSPQENSIVNTFHLDYWTNDDGTFEIRTFYDGEVYANKHKQTEMKFTHEFGAGLRGGCVIISFTPDGGETAEILHEDAEYFYSE